MTMEPRISRTALTFYLSISNERCDSGWRSRNSLTAFNTWLASQSKVDAACAVSPWGVDEFLQHITWNVDIPKRDCPLKYDPLFYCRFAQNLVVLCMYMAWKFSHFEKHVRRWASDLPNTWDLSNLFHTTIFNVHVLGLRYLPFLKN